MTQRRINGLMREIRNEDGSRVLRLESYSLGSRLRRGLASIPHDGAHESQVCGGQWAPIHRDHIRFPAAIRIVNVLYYELRAGRNRYRNSHQPPARQQTVCLLSCFTRRDIDVMVAVGSIVGSENRIETVCASESLLYALRRNRPA